MIPQIEELSRSHDRSAFSSGSEALDRYLREGSSQDLRRGTARVLIARPPENQTVIGYYTVSVTSIERSSLPEALARKLPRYPIPAALIGRLAIDRHFAGRGLGTLLMMHAADTVRQAASLIAIYTIVVDPKDETAASFYRKFGFAALPGAAPRMFLPLASLPR